MKTYVVGNWKMNLSVGDASLYLHRILKRFKAARGVEVVVAPSLIAIQTLALQLMRNKSRIRLCAQNFCQKDYGPYTGEVSVAQLKGLVNYALVGHSERRYVFHDSDKDIREKMAAAVRAGIRPILCIGETEMERTFGETADVIRDQLLGGLAEVSQEDLRRCIVAYEPVWAINNNKKARLAAPDEVARSIVLIRGQLGALYGKEIAEEVPVLYGGSVTAATAGGYLTIPGVNGLLVGGASLISDEFLDIIDVAKRVRK
ncbi:MAG: triose-phosphate isomerase [Candidatus Saccharibacteria bacterium]|nr:triose-phosphate isomerase [Candidatus Saccharibacteria bacterium]